MRTRVTSTTTDSLTWDEFGRLVSVKRVVSGQSPATTTFAYDGFGRRIRKATSATTVHYLWDGDQILAELNGSGVVRKTYTYYPGIDQPRSVTTGGQTYFFSAEPDGTVNGVIRKSDRTVVAQYQYTPWGELESAAQAFDSVSTLRWKGLPYDAETGFYYMRARYYDPKIRRFISEDPIGLEGGINVYAFASGDPVNGSDPSGLDPQYLPGVTVYGNTGYTGCWKWMDTYSENGIFTKTWGQEQCGGGANGPAIVDLVAPRYEPASGPTSPSVGAQPAPDKATCIMLGVNAAAQTAGDIAVIAGVGIAAKTAYYGGKTLGAGLLSMLDKWALEELEMTYLMQGRAASKAQLMRTGRTKAFGVVANGATSTYGASAWNQVKSIAQSFVPGWNAYNAISDFKNACIQ